VVNIPGTAGAAGAAGAPGVNAFALTTISPLTIPATGSNVTQTVDSSVWMAVGQILVISDRTNKANFQVVSFPSTSAVVLKALGYIGDTAAGTNIAIGATVSPAGLQQTITGLPASFTDNTGGSVSSTLAAGVGILTIPLYVNLADLANHDVLTAYTPGYAFKILGMSFAVEKAATTAAKLATLTPYISGAAVTGGVISLTSANCTPQGAVIAGTTVTAANTGSSASTISITGSSVTAFVEGAGWILLQVQNLDTANAVASIASKINALITAL
jgi:hypothetical protein